MVANANDLSYTRSGDSCATLRGGRDSRDLAIVRSGDDPVGLTPGWNLTLKGGAIASAAAFGTQALSSRAYLSGGGAVASSETFGSPALASTIALSGGAIAAPEAFGTGIIAGPISGGAIASQEAFGSRINPNTLDWPVGDKGVALLTGRLSPNDLSVTRSGEGPVGLLLAPGIAGSLFSRIALSGGAIGTAAAFGVAIIAGPIIGGRIASGAAFGDESVIRTGLPNEQRMTATVAVPSRMTGLVGRR